MTSKRAYILACMAAVTFTADAFALPGFDKKHSKTPIEVTSDSLEVLQEENRAVFTGHVVAIQGDVRLKADKMTVFYSQKKEPAKRKAEPSTPGAGSIKKIEAAGSVFLSTP